MTNWSPILKQLAPKSPASIFNIVAANLGASFDEWDLKTPLRQAHFLSEVVYESGGLKSMTENLSYSSDRISVIFPKLATRAKELAMKPVALGNAAYANRFGNGDEASGDGYRYRGRCFLQHTFKSNYQALSDALGIDLVADPDRLADPAIGLRAAMHFFVSRGCLPYADTDNTTMVRKKVQGGDLGLAEVRALKDRVLKLLAYPTTTPPMA